MTSATNALSETATQLLDRLHRAKQQPKSKTNSQHIVTCIKQFLLDAVNCNDTLQPGQLHTVLTCLVNSCQRLSKTAAQHCTLVSRATRKNTHKLCPAAEAALLNLTATAALAVSAAQAAQQLFAASVLPIPPQAAAALIEVLVWDASHSSVSVPKAAWQPMHSTLCSTLAANNDTTALVRQVISTAHTIDGYKQSAAVTHNSFRSAAVAEGAAAATGSGNSTTRDFDNFIKMLKRGYVSESSSGSNIGGSVSGSSSGGSRKRRSSSAESSNSSSPCADECLLAHPLVADHHSNHGPVYSASPRGGCPKVHCNQCGKSLPSSQHLIYHICDASKVLSWEDVKSLAAAARCSPLKQQRAGSNGGTRTTCFLCRRDVIEGQEHACGSNLWRVLVVDQSQLPHVNPAKNLGVLLQLQYAKIRRECRVIVHIVCMCPPDYLPATLKTTQAAMMAAGVWPRLRFLMLLGPSGIVKGEQGSYSLLEPDITWSEHNRHLRTQLLGQHRALGAGILAAPSLTRTIVGFYTGALLVSEREGDTNLAVTMAAAADGAEFFYDPTNVGSAHILLNQGHEQAAVAECKTTYFVDNPQVPHILLVVRLQQGLTAEGKQARLAALKGDKLLVELTWDYAATTTNPDDPLLSVPCACSACQQRPDGARRLLEPRCESESERA